MGVNTPVPIECEVGGGAGQAVQVAGGAPPVLPCVQSGHTHSHLRNRSAVHGQDSPTV
jgi:hypothetical protein